MNPDLRRSDWLASLCLPGLAQGMYFMPRLGLLFFLGALAAWLCGGWRWGLSVHALAALHAAWLVWAHFSGRRTASSDGVLMRRALRRG